MSWWPGWNSIDDAGWWSHLWFWAGIACLIALAAAEVVSHMYSLRKDELVAIAESTAVKQRKIDADAAEARRKTEVEGLQKQLTEADQKVEDVQKRQAPRRLSDAQKQSLITALSPHSGQRFDISAMHGDAESIQFAHDFLPVFVAAGWVDVGSGVAQAVIVGTGARGIQVSLNQAEVEAGRVPQAALTLVRALMAADLLHRATPDAPNIFMNPGVPTDRINFRVGTKPDRM